MMETKARMRAAVFGICVNLCLFMVKLYVGISTNSISIYVDSLNNALDSVVCIIALVGFWLSVRTSPKYPFGLGRAEDLTGFITAVVIVGTGFGFGYVSLERTLYPAPVWFSVRYAVIIAVTAVVKLLLGAYYKFKDRRHPSPVLKGLFTDSVLDFFITLSTLISFTLTRVAGVPVDGYFGIAISAVLLISGAKSCVSSFACILGKRETEDCDRAQALLTAQPGCSQCAVPPLRTAPGLYGRYYHGSNDGRSSGAVTRGAAGAFADRNGCGFYGGNQPRPIYCSNRTKQKWGSNKCLTKKGLF